MAKEATGKSTDKLELKEFLKNLKDSWIDLKNPLTEENKKKIAEYPMEDLIRYSNEVSGTKGASDIRSNILSVIALKYEIDQENKRRLQEDSNKLAERQKLKDKEEKAKNAKISALKNLLMDEKDQTELQKNSKEYNEVQYRLEIIAMNDNNKTKLEEILKKQKDKADAEKAGNAEKAAQLDNELYDLRKDIKNICGQKDELYYKYFWEKFDDNDVNKFKRIVSPFVKTKVKHEWQDVYWVMSPFKKHRKARRKLNYVIAWMNMAGSNSEKWIINIMCRCKWEEVNPKEIYNWIRARHLLRTNPTRFWEIYKEQKDKFINDLISELKGDKERLSESDKKTIDQIKKRLDWYEEDFNRRHTAPIK